VTSPGVTSSTSCVIQLPYNHNEKIISVYYTLNTRAHITDRQRFTHFRTYFASSDAAHILREKFRYKLVSLMQGYIYGNVTSQGNVTGCAAFVVLDSEYFAEFFSNRLQPRPRACPAMFDKLKQIMWDEHCNKNGFGDFLRVIPCRWNELCDEEKTDPSQVITGHQFTYYVRDTYQPRCV